MWPAQVVKADDAHAQAEPVGSLVGAGKRSRPTRSFRSRQEPHPACVEGGIVAGTRSGPKRTVAVGTWGPFVFANPDPHAEPLQDALGDLPEVVAEHGLDVESLRINRRVHYEIRANWKIALENYLECYHCQVTHPRLVEVIDERRLELRAVGLRTSQFAPVDQRSLEGRGPIDARGAVPSAQNHLWFPTLKFNVLPGHPNLSIGPLWPTSPVTCEGYLDYWFADSVDQQWIDELFALDTQVGAEDTALVEAAQRGTSAGMIERGWALGGTESLIGHFHDCVRERLGLDNDPR
jgi:phenylpropionate dioxygenase-like ring-hydroxylating dioxygenase large terminal subunit